MKSHQTYKAIVRLSKAARSDRILLELSCVRGIYNGIADYAGLRGKSNKRFMATGRMILRFRDYHQRRRFVRAVTVRMLYLSAHCSSRMG